MSNVDNTVLEHLVAMRGEVKEMRTELRDELAIIKQRLSSVERGFSGTHDDSVTIQMRFDRVDSRIDKMERRLELS